MTLQATAYGHAERDTGELPAFPGPLNDAMAKYDINTRCGQLISYVRWHGKAARYVMSKR